jgi:hypothetical protein
MPAVFDRAVEAIKQAIREKNPKMDPKEVESRAFAIATKKFQEKYGRNP